MSGGVTRRLCVFIFVLSAFSPDVYGWTSLAPLFCFCFLLCAPLSSPAHRQAARFPFCTHRGTPPAPPCHTHVAPSRTTVPARMRLVAPSFACLHAGS